MSFLSVSRKSLRRLADAKEGFNGRPRRGLRDDFKLISMWDFCLPRKQRTSTSSFPSSPLLSLFLHLPIYLCLSLFLLFHGTFCWRHPRGRASPNSSTSFGSRLRIFFPLTSFIGDQGNFLHILYSAPMSRGRVLAIAELTGH